MKMTSNFLRGTFALCAAITMPSQAAVIVWDSTSNGNWSTAADWNPETVPGTVPTDLDQVTFGAAGFSGTATRQVTVDGTYTVRSLAFAANASALQQYQLLAGTGGKIIIDAGTGTSSIAFGGVQGGAHSIAANLEINSPLNISVGGEGNRSAAITGSITAGTSPVSLNINGGGGNNARLDLSGSNNFSKNGISGELNLTSANGVRLGSVNAASGAVLKLSGVDGNLSSNKTIYLAASGNYNFDRMEVEATGRIQLTVAPAAVPINTDVGWQSISIAANKTLQIFNGNNNNFDISGAGKVVSLGTGSQLQIVQSNASRFLHLRIGNGALLEGNGTLLTRATAGTLPQIQILSGGIVDAGIGSGNTGILHTGAAVNFASTPILMQAGSTLRMQINGLVAGTEHDQIAVDAGSFTVSTGGAGVLLDLSVEDGFTFDLTSEVTLIQVAAGATFTGTFVDINGNPITEGQELYLGTASGLEWYAKLSYAGANNSVFLYDFSSVVPEPTSAGLVLAGLGLLARRRTRRTRNA